MSEDPRQPLSLPDRQRLVRELVADGIISERQAAQIELRTPDREECEAADRAERGKEP